MLEQEYVPMEHLPDVMRDAIEDVANKTMATRSMIMSAALSSAALACQQGFRVRRPSASACSLGLYILQIAESGDRKTTVDGQVTTWIKQVLDEIRPHFEDERPTAQARLIAWDLQMRVAQRKLRQHCEKNDESQAATINAIKELLRTKPKTPKMPVLKYTDTTPEALVEGMSSSWSGVCLHFDEGGQFFRNRIGSSFGLLNHLWSGAPYTTHRKSQESFDLEDYALTAMLWIQPVALRKFLAKRGDEAINSGFLPRFLVTMPISNQGLRQKDPYAPLDQDVPGRWMALGRFNEFLKNQFLQAYSLNGGVPKVELGYTGDAQMAWREFDNQVEYSLGKYHSDSSVRAAYAKLGEQVARISAIFHCLEGCTGVFIDRPTLNRAINVGNWYMQNYIRLLSDEGEFTVEGDAKKLCDWLGYRASKHWNAVEAIVDIPLVDLYRFGPHGLRSKGRLWPAIEHADKMGMVKYIRTKPAHFKVSRPFNMQQQYVQQVSPTSYYPPIKVDF